MRFFVAKNGGNAEGGGGRETNCETKGDKPRTNQTTNDTSTIDTQINDGDRSSRRSDRCGMNTTEVKTFHKPTQRRTDPRSHPDQPSPQLRTKERGRQAPKEEMSGIN